MVERARLRPNLTGGQVSDVPTVLSVKSELSGVVENKNRTVGSEEAIARCIEVARQYVSFAYPAMVEKPVRRFRIRPILARERNRPAWTRR